MMSEDKQPNEARSSWKGNHRIPVIRPSYPQRTASHAKHNKRSFLPANHDYPSKRPRAQEQSDYTAQKQRSSQTTGVSDARRVQNEQRVKIVDLPAPDHVGRRHNSADTKSDLANCFRAELTHSPNFTRTLSPSLTAPTTAQNPPHVDIPPLKTSSCSVPTEPLSTRGESSYSAVSPSSTLPRFRSGKILIDSDGPATTSYNESSDLSSFWKIPPINRPSSTPLIAKLSTETSSMMIDLTLDEDDNLDITASHPIASSSRLTPPLSRRSYSRSSSPDPMNLTDNLPPSILASFSTGSIRSGPLFNLARHGHDKPRRLLDLYENDDIANVSMHGFVDKIYIKPSKQRRIIREPENSSRELVNDACVIKTADAKLVVLGHARDDGQVSIFESKNQNIRYVDSFNRQQRAEKATGISGISALCSMLQPLKFATGGFDHAVHLWDINEELSASCGNPLVIKHTAPVHSLLSICDSSHKLLSAGADCTANVYDLSSERVVNTIKMSNSVHHIYRTGTPFCTLFQVAHREHQFELRDHRLVPREPIRRFGFDCSNQKLGRYAKGDLDSELFAYGDKDGCVRVWDLRNVQQPLVTVNCLPGKIAHVVFHRSRLVASSEDNQIATVSYSHCSAAA